MTEGHREAPVGGDDPDRRTSFPPFGRRGLDGRPPDEAAEKLLAVIDSLTAADTGTFLDYRGENPPW